MKAFNFITKSISAKLVALFLLVSILPLGIVSIISYRNSKNALTASINAKIASVASSRGEFLEVYLAVNLDFIQTISAMSFIRDNMNNINHGIDIKQSQALLETSLEKFNTNSNIFYRSKILNKNGIVVATTKSVFDDVGTNQSSFDYFTQGLKGKYISEPYISPELGIANVAYSCPIYAPNTNDVIGVLVIHQALNEELNRSNNTETGSGIENITINPEGMGQTGETYIVNSQGLIITHSRLNENVFLTQKVNNTTLNLIKSSTGTLSYQNYTGTPVIGQAYKIEGTNWFLICEFNTLEVFAPIRTLQNKMLVLSAIILILVLLVAFFISRYFTVPILKLSKIAKSMALGKLDTPIEIKLTDEIGQLGDSFKTMQKSLLKNAAIANEIANGNLTIDIDLLSNDDALGLSFKTMIEKLRSQIKEIGDSIQVFSSSTSEIMASITQLASTSSETATAVSETTTTVEEVKQTTEVSNYKAKEVSDKANYSANISKQGEKAIENTIEGMYQIQKQMGSIANIVVRLSEQSQTIGEITSSVNELAEQSNLLAVNAAIEAAKAGEYGKGFGVVAQEIKNLSESSKEANLQIRNILKEIQKSISTAVMVTEEGNKAVAEGLKLNAVSKESIKALSQSVSDSVNASIQIAASSMEQLEGMDQIAIAMESIKIASLQASTSTSQSAVSVKDIQDMAQNLSKLMTQYKM